LEYSPQVRVPDGLLLRVPDGLALVNRDGAWFTLMVEESFFSVATAVIVTMPMLLPITMAR